MNPAQFLAKTKTYPHWQRIGIGPHHGICIPLFSLRTKKSRGIGEFCDLIPMIDWCKKVGFDCIQLLPLNDSGNDPSPYNALSSCALDPIYLSLHELPNAAPPDFFDEPLKKNKLQWLFRYFEHTFFQMKDDPDYRSFLKEQHSWLHDYALFKACKNEYNNTFWKDWPKNQQSPTTCKVKTESIDFQTFLQYHAFRQIEKVKSYATQQGIFLKGDVPILISPDSADVWAESHLFDLNFSAGAPPDYYNPLGQRWGFPLFVWDEHRKNQFAWWKRRLTVTEKLFHLYRIDHVVGFFRIWAIEGKKRPKFGQFIPADEKQWETQGREILNMMIDASPLLPIAEDLGTIPPIARIVLHELGICGTKVMRWERKWKDDCCFIPFQEYDPISMTTLSTPDSDTLQLWWKDYKDESKAFAKFKNWSYTPELQIWQRKEILRDSHHTTSLFHINLLQEYLALFPTLVSQDPEKERINIPGKILPSNWTYRFVPTIEELLSHEDLAKEIKEILV